MVKKKLFMLVVAGLMLAASMEICADEWGDLMSVQSRTNIRAKRSSDSKVVGKLAAGQRVRADFLKDGWYAVFELTEKSRDEDKAMGYVAASLLHPQKQNIAATLSEDIKPGVEDNNAEHIDDTIVSVKNIGFDISKDSAETISIEFNRFYMPALYSIEKKTKKIILIVTNTDFMKKEWSRIPVNGKMIKQIRSTLNDGLKLMRIEVDIEPEATYSASVTVDKVKNIYTLEITNISQIIPTPPLYRMPW